MTTKYNLDMIAEQFCSDLSHHKYGMPANGGLHGNSMSFFIALKHKVGRHRHSLELEMIMGDESYYTHHVHLATHGTVESYPDEIKEEAKFITAN